jgi:hypothetical protein
MDDDGFDYFMDDDGLSLDDVIEDPFDRAIGLAEALIASCQDDLPVAPPERVHAVLRERYDEAFVDLVLNLIAHYRPSTSSWRQ